MIDQPPSMIDVLSPARRSIVEYIKRQGRARAEDIAHDLHITVSGVRQHLASLSAEGFVTHDVQRGRPGRPKHYFRLTGRGEDLFPKAYREFSTQAIQFLSTEAPGLVERLYDYRVELIVQRLRSRLAGLSLKEQIDMIARGLTEEGYMAEGGADEDGTYHISAHNCALLDLARIDPRICDSERCAIEKLLPGATVEREQSILDGSTACVYRVRPRAASAAAG